MADGERLLNFTPFTSSFKTANKSSVTKKNTTVIEPLTDFQVNENYVVVEIDLYFNETKPNETLN